MCLPEHIFQPPVPGRHYQPAATFKTKTFLKSITADIGQAGQYFFTQETGIAVKAVYDSEAQKTTGLVTRIIAERGRPRADVFWNNEVAQTIVLKDKGALEAYVGFRTLEADGVPFESDDRFEHPTMKRALAALARGIRILLALYRPDHIVLMGGTVNIFSPALQQIEVMANDGLTRAAPARWSLTVGRSDNFAAAIGAATLAATS